MASNGELEPGFVEFPARIYPGMFDREYQATLRIRDQEVNVIVSRDHIVLEGSPPAEDGVLGRVKVSLVFADHNGFIIDLPGEPLGTTRRFRLTGAELKGAMATT